MGILSSLHYMIILLSAPYSPDTDGVKKQIKEKLLIFESKIIRRIYGPTVDPNGLRRRRTNEETNTLLKQRNIVRYINVQRLAWLGHLKRMHEGRTTKKITHWKPLSSRPKGRPKVKWEEDVPQDLKIMKIKSWKTLVRRKEQWKEIVELAKTHLGL
jgi:hypothetical protein